MKWIRVILFALTVGIIGIAGDASAFRGTVVDEWINADSNSTTTAGAANGFYLDGNTADSTAIRAIPNVPVGPGVYSYPDTADFAILASSSYDSANATFALDGLVFDPVANAYVKVCTISSFLTMYISDAGSVVSVGTDTLNATSGTWGVWHRAVPWATFWAFHPTHWQMRTTSVDAATDSTNMRLRVTYGAE